MRNESLGFDHCKVSTDVGQSKDMLVPVLINGCTSGTLCEHVFLEAGLCLVLASFIISNLNHH